MNKTILVVEDHPLYRAALVHMLEAIVGNQGTITANSAEEGLRMIDRTGGLSAILLDLHLPGAKGVEAIKAFQIKCPSVPIIMVSASEDRRDANMAFRAGVMAFVSKGASAETLIDVVERVLAGTLNKPEWVTANGKVSNSDEHAFKLNDRQREIMALLVKGLSNKEIALQLGLAEITIKVHVSALFRLLGVVNRTQAVIAIRQLGL
ncbi:response regulator transcription factor [Duganella qianjiadongensis]|uniref:Response regulator n=1 Tax=Duganella qianjiadongensis TaxID=2692176 RepID=A0ABW9VT10_9BURK|nr:response regulator transcription factor [Duganella qianjiadongensis]MYM42211.1 response regulator [Duganella qianjiadongensis]